MKKSKVKPKVKQKKVKKKVGKVTRKKPVPVTNLGNFDDDSDWRLKSVHQIINQLKKQIYDLSINVEGEHDHICKTIQRCHDRIEHVEGLVMQLSAQSLAVLRKIDGMVETIESLADKRKEPYDWKRGIPPEGYSQPWNGEQFGVKEKADAEECIREALKDMDDDD